MIDGIGLEAGSPAEPAFDAGAMVFAVGGVFPIPEPAVSVAELAAVGERFRVVGNIGRVKQVFDQRHSVIDEDGGFVSHSHKLSCISGTS